MSIEVRSVTTPEVLPLRAMVLRAGQPVENATFPGDDDPDTLHLAAFRKDVIVAVVSLYQREGPVPAEGDVWQLRGMAVAPEEQGQGVGTQLLKAAIRELAARGATLVWCNARISAEKFYQRHGWTPHGEIFAIPGLSEHRIWWRRLP